MGWLLLVLNIVYPLNSEADTQFLRAAFDQKVNWKRCEERLETARWLETLGIELESLEPQKEANCVQKSRAAFFETIQSQATQSPLLVKKLELQKSLSQEDFSLNEIQKAFPDTKEFSLLEWRIFREWFGDKNQAAQLHSNFSISKNKDALAEPLKAPKILWILDPYRKMVSDRTILEPTNLLAKNPKIEIIELSPYGNAESQAEELKNILNVKAKEHITLISTGGASSIVMKTLDLNPSLRASEKIQSWINIEGKLYGEKPKKTRGLASAPDAFQEKTLMGVRLQYLDSLERQPSLGKGFPIFNVIFGEKFTHEVREKILVEAETIQMKKPKDLENLFRRK
jgi:hypothetical protein